MEQLDSKPEPLALKDACTMYPASNALLPIAEAVVAAGMSSQSPSGKLPSSNSSEGRTVTRSRRGRVSGHPDLYELEHGDMVVVTRRVWLLLLP